MLIQSILNCKKLPNNNWLPLMARLNFSPILKIVICGIVDSCFKNDSKRLNIEKELK